jgi:hypothetical protein
MSKRIDKIGILINVILALLMLSFMVSCASQKHPKKCNGKRGIQTPMGVM